MVGNDLIYLESRILNLGFLMREILTDSGDAGGQSG
jgi:hypothetical protein